MKKPLHAAAAFLLAASLQAQPVPNGDFEEWNSVNLNLGPLLDISYNDPEDWHTLNGITLLSSISVLGADDAPVSRSADNYSGNYSLLAKTVEISGRNLKKDTVIGVAFTRFKVNKRPSSLNGFFKADVKGNFDSLGVLATALRWDEAQNQSVAVGVAFLGITKKQNTFTSFQAPFIYESFDAQVDSVYITVYTGADRQKKKKNTPGTSVWLDQLNLDYSGPLGLQASEALASFVLFPNPASGVVKLASIPSTANSYRIINMHGTEVAGHLLEANAPSISLKNLQPGIYNIELLDAQAQRVARQKLVVHD